TGTLTLSFSFYMAHGTNSSSADFFRVKVVGSTTSTVFEELGAANNDDAVWESRSINISSFAGQTVRIRIEAADASTASLVEAAVDDVRIVQQP
ncbi:MAG: zinc carboxypeptidase, partial [Thermoanaerobaculia bacterium]